MDEKAYELVDDVSGLPNLMSNCCSGKVYAPTDEWARCLWCLEMCDVVEME